MKQLVIMPGGFHPFHPGHLALYQSALKAFPGADVKVAATNDTSARPFPFELKEKIARLAGVPASDFYQVKSPFRAEEITKNYDPATTQLIFVRSKKDSAKPPIPGGILKNGSPAYLQPISRDMAPMTQHAYMAYLPVKKFGPGMTGASDIRAEWPTLDQDGKIDRVMSLYPRAEENPKLAKTVVDMWDEAMGTQVAEATGDERFDNIMSRIRREPAIPDPQMPPTDVKDLYHWAVKHHKPYHKIFAHWANREGYKSVAPALQKAGNLDSDALDYWTPDVWKLWFGPDSEMPHHWSKERVPDELRDYLEGVFDAYDNIWQDWPTEYRQIGDRGVAEAFDNPYKTKTEKSEYGDVDMLAKLPDGTNLSIMFNHEGDNEWQVEFYRDNSQEVTGQGDAQRIFATVLAAIQKFVKKYQPDVIKFSAEKSNNSDSRSSLYDRLVSRFAQKLGYNDYSEEYMSSTMYELSKQSQGVDEEVTRQMSQGGLRASYQAKYNQPMMEDYLDEARS